MYSKIYVEDPTEYIVSESKESVWLIKFKFQQRFLLGPASVPAAGGVATSELRAAASRTTGKRVQHTTTSWWAIPYCSSCSQHKAAYDFASKWSGIGLGVGIVGWVFLGLFTGSGWLGFIIGLALTVAGFCYQIQKQQEAKALMCESCTTPSDAVRYISWHGTFHTFVFSSKTYLDKFIASNSRKTMSDVREV